MVDGQLAFSFLQLVAPSLPAFVILLQMVVESDMAYTRLSVPITTAGMRPFLLAGVIIAVNSSSSGFRPSPRPLWGVFPSGR